MKAFSLRAPHRRGGERAIDPPVPLIGAVWGPELIKV